MVWQSQPSNMACARTFSAPFHMAMFIGVGVLVIVMGRMIIDLFITGSDPASLSAAQAALRHEIIMSEHLPDVQAVKC